ncbi:MULTISPECIES: hypothetical protein [Bacillales]|uniref:hypothetical protein n=1 Tax=Bacillales TaxID=1385 RepID=UPI001EF0E024|nr:MULTISPECIES: hypothetical protein [Bacillales]
MSSSRVERTWISNPVICPKLVSWFGDNDKKGLPQLVGTAMVLDSQTGVPQGILSGEHITCMRTGAAGGVGAKYLARPESENLLK